MIQSIKLGKLRMLRVMSDDKINKIKEIEGPRVITGDKIDKVKEFEGS